MSAPVTDPTRPKLPDDVALHSVDVEPVLPEETPAPPGLTVEAPEQLTEEDLRAREMVGFALDLEPLLPGPAVGSERILLETDPAAARRLGVRSEWQPAPSSPMTLEAPLPPPDPVEPDHHGVDLEPVLSPLLPPERGVEEPEALEDPVAMPPVDLAREVRRAFIPAHGNAAPQGARSWPVAWAWAGLGASPAFGGRMAQPARPGTTPGAASPGSAEDMLELAAVGTDDAGVTEMLLIFKEDVLRGLTCKLRVEPGGLFARFVAPDETVRRYVDSTAEDLVARLRRRGMRVGGWTVEVAR